MSIIDEHTLDALTAQVKASPHLRGHLQERFYDDAAWLTDSIGQWYARPCSIKRFDNYGG